MPPEQQRTEHRLILSKIKYTVSESITQDNVELIPNMYVPFLSLRPSLGQSREADYYPVYGSVYSGLKPEALDCRIKDNGDCMVIIVCASKPPRAKVGVIIRGVYMTNSTSKSRSMVDGIPVRRTFNRLWLVHFRVHLVRP